MQEKAQKKVEVMKDLGDKRAEEMSSQIRGNAASYWSMCVTTTDQRRDE